MEAVNTDLRIWKIYLCNIFIYWVHIDGNIFDLRTFGQGDRRKIRTEISLLSGRKKVIYLACIHVSHNTCVNLLFVFGGVDLIDTEAFRQRDGIDPCILFEYSDNGRGR